MEDITFAKFPEPVQGYELEPKQGYFSVIIPEATTNLVTNPSLEVDTTGFSAIGGSIAQTFAWQAFGSAGLAVTPASLTESGAYYGTVSLTNGSTYTASVVFQGEKDKVYYIWFATTGSALLGTKRSWVASGFKQRIWVTYTETSSTTRRIIITRDAKYSDTNVFYLDGLQVEAKAYPTTYCDGDQQGFVLNQTDYSWSGTEHASTSVRSALTRSGGREYSLLDLGFHVLSILGLGMAPIATWSTPIPGLGEFDQGSGTASRDFSLVGSIVSGGAVPQQLHTLRSGLIDAFRNDLIPSDQPIILRYYLRDYNGTQLSESVDIVCRYIGGMEGSWDNHQHDKLALQFRSYIPFFYGTYSNGADLSLSSLKTFNNILERTADGVWKALATGCNGNVLAIAIAPDGTLYAGGAFTLASGVANTAHIAKWNGSSWSALGTGVNNDVYALAIAPDGTLYAGGAFTSASGVANTTYIAKWNGSTWSALGTAVDSFVWALATTSDGSLYAGGSFTSASGVANTLRIAKWNGSSWSALGTGANQTVYALTTSLDGTLYAGGLFTLAGGITNTVYIAKWNGSAWSALGTGMNNTVYSLYVSRDGMLYAGGSFTAINGGTPPSLNHIGKWNGSAWSALGSGPSGTVNAIAQTKNSNTLASGTFTSAGGVSSQNVANWNGTTWLPNDADIVATTVQCMTADKLGNIYFGLISGTSANTPTYTTLTGKDSEVSPIIKITGSGTLISITNCTNGRALYFNNFVLGASEVISINTDPLNFSVVSSFRGNVSNYILRGSTKFQFESGQNNIAVLINSVGGAASVHVIWTPRYWGVEQAVS